MRFWATIGRTTGKCQAKATLEHLQCIFFCNVNIEKSCTKYALIADSSLGRRSFSL